MGATQQVLLAGGGGDPAIGNVVLLLHMNGTDASTTFTDVKGHTFTVFGAEIDTAQSKFGGAAGLFDGTGDWIDTPDSADWTLGTSNFTIEMWARFNALGVQSVLCAQCNNAVSNATTSFLIRKDSNNTILAFVGEGGTTPGLCGSVGTVTTGQWYHLAYVRNGISFKLYIDGTEDGNYSSGNPTVNDSAYKLSIGRPGEAAGNYFNGWIDDFRFTVGTARYTANFTPPAAEFPDV